MIRFFCILGLWLCASLAIAQVGPLPGMGPLPVGIGSVGGIGISTVIGTKNTGGSIASTTITGSNIVAGNLVYLCIGEFSTAATGPSVSSISDGTNTYTKAVAAAPAGSSNEYGVEIWYKANASAVASPTITISLSNTFSSGSIFLATAAQVSGIASSPLDQTPTPTVTSTSAPTITSGSLAQANELAVGCISINNTPTVTEAVGFTRTQLLTSAGGFISNVAYRITSSTSAVTYAPTLSTSQETLTLLATFKGS